MEKVVLDASLVVKFFVDERDSSKALKIRDAYVGGKMKPVAPELLKFEVLNALFYKKLFSIAEIKEIAESLDAYSFELYPLRGEYAQKTVELAFENNITIYDAAYVSLAILQNAPLYTADKKLKEKLGKNHQKFVKCLDDF